MNFDGYTLDFSQFHPLDHWPGDQRCRTLPGGLRNHLALAWHYKWSSSLAVATLCRIGLHRPAQGWSDEHGDHTLCAHCWKYLHE